MPTPEDTPALESPKTTPVPGSPPSDSTEPHEASTIDVRPAEADAEANAEASIDYTPFGTSSQPNRPGWTTVTIDADDHVVEGPAPELWLQNPAATGPAGSTARIDELNILLEGSRRNRRYAAALKRLPELAGYYISFAAAMKKELPVLTASALHRDYLPPEPRNYQEALRHPFRDS